MGDLALATAISQVGAIIIGVGTASTAGRLVASDESSASGIWWSTAAIRTIPAVLLAFALVLVGSQILEPRLHGFFGAVAVGWLLYPLRSEWVLVAFGDLTAASASRVISMVTMALLALLLIQTPADYVLVPILLAVPNVVYPISATAFGFLQGMIGRPPQWSTVKSTVPVVLLGAWHYVVADLGAFVYSGLDRMILYWLASPLATGLYDAAYRVVQPFYLISTVANDAMFRPLAQTGRTAASRAVMRRYSDLMLSLTLPVGAFLTIFSGLVVGVLYGRAFAESAPILALLGWVISIGYVAGLMMLPMVPWGMSGTYARATGAGALMSIAANILLIPTLMGIGAAIAGVLAKAAAGLVALQSFDRVAPESMSRLCQPFIVAALVAGLTAYLASLMLADIAAAILFISVYVAAISGHFRLFRPQPYTATDS